MAGLNSKAIYFLIHLVHALLFAFSSVFKDFRFQLMLASPPTGLFYRAAFLTSSYWVSVMQTRWRGR